MAKAEHQLTSYGRGIFCFVAGTALLTIFAGSIISVLVENKGTWLRLSAVITASEVAAWRLKWVAPPILIGVIWTSARSLRVIKSNRSIFSGLRLARYGFANALLTAALVATLIGITVPERLRRHQWAVEAESNARWYTINSALLEYKALKGTYPSDPKDLLRELPDPYGTLAEALRDVDVSGYQPGTVIASASNKVKTPALRGGVLRNASTSNSDTSAERGVIFTRYEWRLPGPDKIMFTDDDQIMRDGVLMSASELSRPQTTSNKPTTP